MMIKIRFKDLEKIVSQCREEEPIEACGILAGNIRDLNGKIVKEVLKI